MKKYGYALIGVAFVILGIIGAILPVMPAIPFFLAAVYYFSKSSKRFRTWFMSTTLYRKYLQGFVKDRSISLKAKIFILIYATSASTAVFIFAGNVYVKISAAVIMAAMYGYILLGVKTSPPKNALNSTAKKPSKNSCMQE